MRNLRLPICTGRFSRPAGRDRCIRPNGSFRRRGCGARRALAAAKIGARLYSQADYRCRKCELDAAIRSRRRGSKDDAGTSCADLDRSMRSPMASSRRSNIANRETLSGGRRGPAALVDRRSQNDPVHPDHGHLALLNLNVVKQPCSRRRAFRRGCDRAGRCQVGVVVADARRIAFRAVKMSR